MVKDVPQCYEILLKMKKQPFAQPVLAPPHNQLYPDYFTKVQDHIDLGIIEDKFKENKYQKVDQFKEDMQKLFDNYLLYFSQISQ